MNIIDRDGLLKIIGEEENAEKTKEVLLSLLKLSEKGNRISEQNVDYAISLTIKEGKAEQLLQLEEDFVARTALGKPVKPKTLGQKSYVDKIRKKYDYLRRRARRNGKDLSCDGYGDYRL